jgi:hypothetical protein
MVNAAGIVTDFMSNVKISLRMTNVIEPIPNEKEIAYTGNRNIGEEKRLGCIII